jgi:predicted transcriptional regulator
MNNFITSGVILNFMKELKFLRKKAQITQKELSSALGLSQSYVNKIENNISDPPYEMGLKIIDYLRKIDKSSTLNIKDLMSSRIFSLLPDDLLTKAVGLMNKENISQLPVFVQGVSVGAITNKTLPKIIGSESRNINEIKVGEVMEESFPVIDKNSPIALVGHLLECTPAILISDKGKIVGIITSHDLHKAIR